MREQQMILFYKRVMLEIEKRDNLISKLQVDIEIKDKVIDYLAEKLEEKSKSMTKGKWKIVAYNQVEKVGGEDE